MQKIARLDELRQDHAPVVGRVSRVVSPCPVILGELHEARVLDAVALVGRVRKNDALPQRFVFGKRNFVVRFREPRDALHRALLVVRVDAHLVFPGIDDFLQFPEREGVRQIREHLVCERIVKTHVVEFDRKRSFVIGRIGNHLRCGDMPAHRIERDLVVRIDHTGAKFDR